MKRLITFCATFLAFISASAYDFCADGIYYNILSETDKTCEVTYKELGNGTDYSGSVIITNEVDGYTVIAIGVYAFADCSGLTSITIPNSLTIIGFNAFVDCSGLTSITIPNSVDSIEDDAFYGCSNIAEVNISCKDNADFASYISRSDIYSVFHTSELEYKAHNILIAGEKQKHIIIPDSVKKIGSYALFGCSDLISVTIPNSVISVGYNAFGHFHSFNSNNYGYYTSSISEVNISCKDDADFASYISRSDIHSVFFASGLDEIFYRDYEIAEGQIRIVPHNIIIAGEKKANITIPENVKSIGEYAFYYCSGLTSITIPNSVTSIANNAFSGCANINEVNISIKDDSDFASYLSRSDIYSVFHATGLNGKTHNFIVDGEKKNTITIPDNASIIADYAFFQCNKLKSITIPNSVTSIGSNAFSLCDSLLSITIPNSVTSIGNYLFYECSSLNSVTIPNSVTSIGHYNFSYCRGLKSITIPNCITSIGIETFYYCDSLQSITIPSCVTTIGDRAFYKCSSLTSLTLPDSLESIGINTFRSCSGLTSITIPNSVVSIGTGAFSRCTGLTSITNLSTTPQTIDSQTFPADGITLHVLPGCADAYRLKEYWRDFVIKEDAVLPVAEEEATTYTIADGTEYTGTSITHAAKLKYTRDFVNTNWQALYIPFAMSYDDFKDHLDIAWLNNVHMYDDDQDGDPDRTMLEFYVMSDGKTKPNTPYLARSKTGGVFTLNMDSVDISPAECNPFECSTFYQTFIVKGTYSGVSGSDMVSNHYYAPAGGGLKYTTNVNASLKPQRWYLKVTNKDGSSVTNLSPSIRVMIDGEEIEDEQTGIRSILSSGNDLRYTTLDGRTLSTDPVNPGIYVRGNKKIIIR